MSSEKLFVLKSPKKHFWLSCQVIEDHFLKAFEKSDLPVEELLIDQKLNPGQLEAFQKLNGRIHLFFLSDILNYQDICQQLKDLQLTNIIYYIPVYGNMTMEVYRWLGLDELLRDREVYLLGASPRSCQQIKRFTNEASIEYVPYCFEEGLIPKTPHPTIDLVYAGRITPQKNVLELLLTFREAHAFNPDLRLHIAGEFHDRMYHLHGYKVEIEKFKEAVKAALSSPGVIYHGQLGQSQLLELYSNCDYFVSMSTYHDEDFGMSACQAASQGLKLILSDWGGHGAFKKNAHMVSVTVDIYNIPKISRGELKKILATIKKPEKDESRQFQERFSYESFILHMKNLMQKKPLKFGGMSDLYKHYAALATKTFPFANTERQQESHDFYLSIYDSYLHDNEP